MRIKINSQMRECKSKSLFALKAELGVSDDAITLYRGFAITSDCELAENDSVIFMDKNQIPKGELLREIMYSRNTPELNEALKNACVGIAGLGGLGSAVAIALARVGVGRMILCDFDTVDASNLNRQQYFLKDLGAKKTAALKENIALINPFVSVETKDLWLDESNVNETFAPCDIVAECFDNAKSKAMIISSLSKPLIAASGIAGYGRSEEIKITQFASNVWICGDLKDAASIGNGLMAPRVGVAAMMQANFILEFIAKNGSKNEK